MNAYHGLMIFAAMLTFVLLGVGTYGYFVGLAGYGGWLFFGFLAAVSVFAAADAAAHQERKR